MRLAMYMSSTLPDGPVLDPPRTEPGRATVLLAVWREHHIYSLYLLTSCTVHTCTRRHSSNEKC